MFIYTIFFTIADFPHAILYAHKLSHKPRMPAESNFELRKLVDEVRASYHAGRQRPISGAKLEAWRHKMFHIFDFLQFDVVLGIVNPFS